jgi:hypothetical protein
MMTEEGHAMAETSVRNDPTVLVLTPVKDAEPVLDRYFAAIDTLTYPRELMSIAFLESDSSDGTYRLLEERIGTLRQRFRSAALFKKDFGFRIPKNVPRWARSIQIERRGILAKSRNHLLFRALGDEDWVLWLDADVEDYPPDVIQRLLATGKEILQPNCVREYGGPSYDLNAWRDGGSRHMHDLRLEGDLVRLHAVGATMLLVKADAHRDGLVFPPFLYGRSNPLIRKRNGLGGWWTRWIRPRSGEIETEGLGIMAHDMEYECWGMPNLEIKHKDW